MAEDEQPTTETWTLALDEEKTCPHCGVKYKASDFGHVLWVKTIEGNYRTCFSLLMKTLHEHFPIFTFTPAEKSGGK